MKKTKKLFAVIAVLALLLLAFICVTFNSSVVPPDVAYATSSWEDKNFKFKQIDVEIEVGKDKIYKVKETLKTRFFRSDVNRGIIRDIQHQTTTTRYINGRKVNGKSFFAKVDNVKASFEGISIVPEIETSADMYSIYMRKPGGYIEGREEPYTFVLEYTYDMSDDSVSGYDDFVFDILGYEMNATELLNAQITFPDEISADKVSVRTNIEGRSTMHEWVPNEEESLKVEGNVITISAQPYAAEKGYTLQVILPDGYFSEATLTFYPYYVITIIALVVGVAVVLTLFLRNVLQRHTLEVREFYPPEELSIMEFSSIWHRGARAKDSAALILKWANLGLLTIEKDGDKHLILRPTEIYDLKSFNLQSVKPQDDVFSDFSENSAEEPKAEEEGATTIKLTKSDKKYFDNLAEKKFYFSLFCGAGGERIFSTRIFKSRSALQKSDLLEDVQELVECGNDKEHLKGGAEKVRTAIPFIGLIPTFGLLIYYSIILKEILPVLFLIFMAAGTVAGVIWRKNPHVLIMLIFPVVFYGAPFGIFAGLFALTAYDYAYLLFIAPVIWAVCMFVLPFFVNGRRTPEAQQTYGRLKGFKNFLLKAELPRIQLMFDENPEYFLDILAWCVIMGISDKVQKRFASLNFTVPEYLDRGIDVKRICRCIHHCHFHAVHQSHSSSSHGGSHFSGGGGGHRGSRGGGGGGGRSRGC